VRRVSDTLRYPTLTDAAGINRGVQVGGGREGDRASVPSGTEVNGSLLAWDPRCCSVNGDETRRAGVIGSAFMY
jgi:hypothetical protein